MSHTYAFSRDNGGAAFPSGCTVSRAPAQQARRRQAVDAAQPPPQAHQAARSTGVVRRWVGDRGFGLIAPDGGGADLFCHASHIVGGNALIQGGWVEFVRAYDARKGKERAEQVSGAGVARHGRGGRHPGGNLAGKHRL